MISESKEIEIHEMNIILLLISDILLNLFEMNT